jgi:hypothetical protein
MLTQRLLQEEIKQVVNLVQFIGTRVALTLSGRSYRGNCPLHPDQSRDLYVYPGLEVWHCYGDCDKGGSVVDFLMKIDGLSYGEALKKLGGEYGCTSEQLGFGSAIPDDYAGGRASQSLDMTTVSNSLRGRAAEKPVADEREAPIDQEAYMTLTVLRRKELESRLRGGGPPDAINMEHSRPVLGNLAYHKGLEDPRLRTVVSDLQPGLCIAYFHNLQEHILLEEASGKTRIADASDYRDAGRALWLDNQGTALIKDLQTGRHSDEISIDGVSDRGFMLLRPKGQRNHSWFIPRSPRGGNRPTYLADGSIFALESFDLDADVLPGYTDISGDFIKLQAADRCSLRHQQHLGLGH